MKLGRDCLRSQPSALFPDISFFGVDLLLGPFAGAVAVDEGRRSTGRAEPAPNAPTNGFSYLRAA
jgi:hypothetical protein